MSEAPDPWALQLGCERTLATHPPHTAAELLRAAADALAPDEAPDHYGDETLVETFEAEMAARLGQPAAVLMPSGTMAQQIALSIHCEQRGADTIALHPTSHLVLWEHAGYAHLHGLRAELTGARDEVIVVQDVRALRMRLGALLLELPQREIGGRLPAWEDLLAQLAWAGERGIATHLDGARLWEAAPGYGVAASEIARRFDSVYVSLYKGLGGIGGCVLAGQDELVAQARVWRRRHGGAVYRLFPLVAAARPGISRLLPQMGAFREHARAIAGELHDRAGVWSLPAVPQTALFHVVLDAPPEQVRERALELARRERVWVPAVYAADGPLPGTSRLELHLGEPALAFSPAEAAGYIAGLAAGGEGRGTAQTGPSSSPASTDSPA